MLEYVNAQRENNYRSNQRKIINTGALCNPRVLQVKFVEN